MGDLAGAGSLILDEQARARLMIEIRDSNPRSLHQAYEIEARAHRNILMQRGVGLAVEWRDFGRFLLDLGPRPSPEHRLVLLNRFERTYGPGRARWMTEEEEASHIVDFDRQMQAKADEQQKILEEAAALRARRGQTPQNSYGQWTSLGGQTVSYTDVAKRLNLPPSALAKVLAAGRSPDELVKRAASADEVINEKADWLPPEPDRRKSFLQAFRMWHLQIQPSFSRAATPAFLFLYSALQMMRESRDQLISENLWQPLGDRATRARDNHPAWNRYCEFMSRAQVALLEIPIYASYSLLSDLDTLHDRVVAAERRFRIPPASKAKAA
jgi:hypothetical protein